MTENLGLATRKTVIIISSSATTATPVASDSSRLLLTTRTTAEIAMTGAIMPNFNTIIIVCCICMTSFVVRVIKLAVLNFSISSMLKEFTFLKIFERRVRASLLVMWLAIRLLNSLQTKPPATTNSISPPVRRISRSGSS